MHNIFLEKLKEANGESKFVIVVNVDVRGFSSFSKIVESAQSALYIKKIFLKILHDYYTEASFYKSTGDGLIIIYDVTEETLKNTTNRVIEISLKLADEFSKLCEKEPMINFKVPDKCGIGISRGPATCLRTVDMILDYSGDTLNMASRLMDCARPEGVVFDEKVGISLIKAEVKKLFLKDEIYLKGISETEPTVVWYTKGTTKFSEALKRPIIETEWESIVKEKKFSEIKEIGGIYLVYLKSKPSSQDQIDINVGYPFLTDGKMQGLAKSRDFSHFVYAEKAGKHTISIDFKKLIDTLNKDGVLDDTVVTLEIRYPKIN